MSLIRSTCDRCYAAKTRCTKDASSKRCHKCIRSGVVCNYSPRGQAGRPLGCGIGRSSSSSQRPTPAMSADTRSVTLPTSFDCSPDLFSNLPTEENTAAYPWDHQPSLDDYGQLLLPLDEAMHGGTYTTSNESSNAAADFVSSLEPSSAQSSSSGPHQDTNSSSEAPSAAASPRSESLHGRLVATHSELIALSESLAVSFSMTDDMDVIYRLSADMTDILQRLRKSGLCYPPTPVAKCHGMTSLLILGCYSYLLEAYELAMEKLRHEVRDTGSLTARQQRAASPERAPRINIGGIRLQVSRKSAAEIHLQLVSQTAQNLRDSLRQFVKQTAAPRCSMDLDDDDESVASNHSGSRTREMDRGDTIAILTTLAEQELRRREGSIFQYIHESAAKETA
ncbi:hypothetical protein MY5147_004703 [Beauveria neobassiana]